MEVRNYISEAKGATDWRGCLMLSMPSDVSRMIAAWSENNIPEDALAGDGREKYSHCTVLYGFPQSTSFDEVETEAMNGLNTVSLIDVVLGPVKRFPASENRPESDVLVIEVKSPGLLAALHERLKDKFNVKTNFPTYNPHVTVAYVKPGSLTELDGNTTFDEYECHCKAMTYSTGPSDNRNRRTVTFEEFSTETRGR